MKMKIIRLKTTNGHISQKTSSGPTGVTGPAEQSEDP